MLYANSHADSDDRIRLGRMTQWRGGEGAPVQGVGQRMFALGDKDVDILALKQITFNPSTVDAEHG